MITMDHFMNDTVVSITRDITCLQCGHNGLMDIHDENDVASDGRLFMHLGHNPFSGNLHYQCPACGILLLVEPMLALGKRAVRGVPQLRPGKKILWRKNVLQGLINSLLAKRFQNEGDECR